MSSQWHIKRGGEVSGPFTMDEIQFLISRGRLSPHDRLKKGATGDWVGAELIPGLFPKNITPELQDDRSQLDETSSEMIIAGDTNAQPPERSDPVPSNFSTLSSGTTPVPPQRVNPHRNKIRNRIFLGSGIGLGIVLLILLILFFLRSFLLLLPGEDQQSIALKTTSSRAASESTLLDGDSDGIETESNSVNTPNPSTEDKEKENAAENKSTTEYGIAVIGETSKGVVELGKSGGGSGIFKVGNRIGSSGSVVYVIDRSGSMGSDNRLERVKSELIAGINSLKSKQRFSVAFFDDQVWLFGHSPSSFSEFSSPKLTLMQATKKNKEEAVEWIRNMTIGGGTDPIPASILAIQAKPSLVMLLSDGEFPLSAVSQITNLNKSRRGKTSRIDCIGLGESVETLQKIAKQNDGRYYPAR